MVDTKGCYQLNTNDASFYDIWFSGVKTDEGAMSEGVYYCRPVKTSHKVFCISTLENFTKDCPGG